MKLKDSRIRLYLIVTIVSSLLIGSFLMGMGLQKMFSNQKLRKEYLESELEWKRELVSGEDEAMARDLRNQELLENMSYVSLERQIYFDDSKAAGEARIANDQENRLSCTITIVRDATGEVIYKSGLIEPGYYIEEIYLSSGLRQGFYPCTAICSFYTQGAEYVGETACKVVVIIKN